MQSFSKEEIRDIIISIAVISVIFAYPNFNLILFYLVAVVIAFLFHELAHRFVARKFGAAAVYKMWPQGLLIGLLLMFTTFRFVAPGAVVIQPYRFGRWGYKMKMLSPKELGLIALSGPLVNLFFAMIFSLIPGTMFSFLAFINGWLAMFNLLPIPPLDGSKVFMWKPLFWLLLFLGAIFLVWPYITGMLAI